MQYLIQYIFAVSVFLLACIVVCVVLYYIIEIIFAAKYRRNLFGGKRNEDMDDGDNDDENDHGDGGFPPRKPLPPFPIGGITPYILYRNQDYEYRNFSSILLPMTISFIPEKEHI